MLAFNHLGRLGYLANQMFQYAAIKGIAAHNNVDYMIPEKEEMQLFQGFKMTTATENFGFLGDTNVRDGRGAPVACPIVMEKGFEFDEELFNNPPENASLYGFFQTDKYFLNVWDELQKDFVFDDEILEPCQEFISDIEGKTASVHLRRGDYLQNSANHYNLSDQWFEEAVSKFPDHTILVFSDDISWCKEQEMFSDERFRFSETKDGKVVTRDGRWESNNMDHWYDLCLQSLCDDNIISNSTFSWWGAYLNNNPDKTVIAPDPKTKWFGPANAHLNTKDVIPESWVLL
mgnify:CR=1 FL=1|tara:strand:- start:7306 stop:8172 length:867 start_codon:yes stop_codon:yes gene_type:complete